MDVECWMVDSFRIQIAHSKFRSPCGEFVSKRSRGVLILDFGFWVGELLDVGCWMEFSIQHLKFKILPWSHGFSGVRQD
jgi:hypothetical protein